jgi:hypothetical protein
MNGELLNEMLTAHFRSERAIDAARRFISIIAVSARED